MNKLIRPELPTDAQIAAAMARGRALRSHTMTKALARLTSAPARWLDRLVHAGQTRYAGERPVRAS